MSNSTPVIMWFRRDLRLADNPALCAAVATGQPVIAVFVDDGVTQRHGAAPRWRLGLGVADLGRRLAARGSRLILRRGRADDTLLDLARQSGASDVFWNRLYDPASVGRDKAVKARLNDAGLRTHSCAGHLLHEPWQVATKTGGFYKVFTPMWRNIAHRDPGAPLAPPHSLAAPDHWPASDMIADWRMGAEMDRGARVVAPHLSVGEDAAQDRLADFVERAIERYGIDRDFPALEATSRLSENLTYGEISVRRCWHAGLRALHEGRAGAERFLKELAWREFAHHLAYHTPHMLGRSWRPEWDSFPWHEDEARPEVQAWKQGRTGQPFVDAAMREMYVTGTMHNRARMIAASYLTKHLMCHWRIGMAWFAECLIDWDPAANAMGWQWVAGSGPDASPYFRIFNPATQADKFDPSGRYRRRWIAEGQADPPQSARDFFAAVPRSWGLSPDTPYPPPIVDLAQGRQRALLAYERRGF